jgi:hypothetical protein
MFENYLFWKSFQLGLVFHIKGSSHTDHENISPRFLNSQNQKTPHLWIILEYKFIIDLANKHFFLIHFLILHFNADSMEIFFSPNIL